MTQTKKEIADRGKWAEKEVQKHLDVLNNQYHDFAYDRQPDARAAGGRLKAALCDFLWWWRAGTTHRVSGLLEVKETKHDYRLAKDKLDQLPRMRKVRNAGGYGLVLVYHSTIGKWRSIPVEWFNGPIPPSWDLSDVPTHDTAQKALEAHPVLFPKAREQGEK